MADEILSTVDKDLFQGRAKVSLITVVTRDSQNDPRQLATQNTKVNKSKGIAFSSSQVG